MDRVLSLLLCDGLGAAVRDGRIADDGLARSARGRRPMDWRTVAAQLGREIDPILAFAFDTLERAGFQFCVHFGTRNAIEKATEEWLRVVERQFSE